MRQINAADRSACRRQISASPARQSAMMRKASQTARFFCGLVPLHNRTRKNPCGRDLIICMPVIYTARKIRLPETARSVVIR